MYFPSRLSLKDFRTRRGAQGEARLLIREARRILKKKGYRIPQSVADEIEKAIAETDAALAQPDVEPLRQAIMALDNKIDEHLAFARKSTAREYFESVVVAVGIALFLRAFVVEAFQIPSGSMIPTLEIGDHIFVAKFSYGVGIPFTNKKILRLAEPKRGDVIVFKYPHQQETDYIKRVVGLPGDRLEIRRNEIFINGRPMARELAPGACRYSEGMSTGRECELWIEQLDGHTHKAIHEPNRATDWGPIDVPLGEVFVMGDNRDNSNDSRGWGTVSHDLIKGKALIVWWSRGPLEGDTSILSKVGGYFRAIRWRRFFHPVE